MVTRQQLQGKWNEVTGRLKEQWSNLSDSDFNRAQGNVEQLVGLVQQKTGRGREEVEKFIDSVVNNSGQMYDRVAATAKEYATEATEAVRKGYEQASANMAAGYHEAEDLVRRRPAESVAVIFGIGLIAGIATAFLLRSGSNQRQWDY